MSRSGRYASLVPETDARGEGGQACKTCGGDGVVLGGEGERDEASTSSRIQRYSRQMLATEDGVVRCGGSLWEKSALIVGAGGLGCPAAMYLVRLSSVARMLRCHEIVIKDSFFVFVLDPKLSYSL